jgi:AbrB family looped-hinge helix DNA binding protein
VSKVTSKFQVTIPRAIARAHGLGPGSQIEFESAGEIIRVRTKRGRGAKKEVVDRALALRWFDAVTARQEARNRGGVGAPGAGSGGARVGPGGPVCGAAWAVMPCLLDTLHSEDFQDGRLYGSVRIVNPFAPR